MKKYIITTLVLFISLEAFTQVAPDKYYVQFTDKDDSPYSINNPEEFLTQRAINRRTRYGIDIIEEDLPVNPQYINGVAAIGVEILNATKWLNGITIETSDSNKLDDIESLPYVQGISKISGKRDESSDWVNKPFFENESYDYTDYSPVTIKNTSAFDYGLSYNQIHMIKGEKLHNKGYTGEGMVIAVLDAGFYGTDTHMTFDSLFDNNQILGTKDFVENGGTVYDHHTHGTSVLSTMGGNTPGSLVGTAPHADYWLLRTEDGASEYIIEEYNWVSGAEFADSVGADVINSSLGYTTFEDPEQDHTYADMDGKTTPVTIGADIAADKGMLVVNSAGNAGSSGWYYIGAPADGFKVFSIGAVDASGILASFSSRGPTADGRIKPNVCAQGLGTLVADAFGSFTYGSGTSFSSPIIAGMSACLWQSNTDYTNEEVMNAIMLTASNASDPNNDIGWGIPDYEIAYNTLYTLEKPTCETFTYFPNPVKDKLYIEYQVEGNKEITVQIIDQLGRIIYSDHFMSSLNGENMITINEIENIPVGVYLISITIDDRVEVGKLIK